VKGIPSWVTYTVLRLLLFVVPLVILLVLHVDAWISVVAAALIGLCLSYVLLKRPREAVSRDLYSVRHREKPLVSADDEAEDSAVDSAVDSPVDSSSPDQKA
jgi:hypothetical protein